MSRIDYLRFEHLFQTGRIEDYDFDKETPSSDTPQSDTTKEMQG